MGLALFRRKKKERKEYTKEQLEAEYTIYKFVNSPQSIGYSVDKPFD